MYYVGTGCPEHLWTTDTCIFWHGRLCDPSLSVALSSVYQKARGLDPEAVMDVQSDCRNWNFSAALCKGMLTYDVVRYTCLSGIGTVQ